MKTVDEAMLRKRKLEEEEANRQKAAREAAEKLIADTKREVEQRQPVIAEEVKAFEAEFIKAAELEAKGHSNEEVKRSVAEGISRMRPVAIASILENARSSGEMTQEQRTEFLKELGAANSQVLSLVLRELTEMRKKR